MEIEAVSYISSGKFTSRGTWIHPSRLLDSNEIIYMTDGEAFIAENENKYHLKAGDVLLLSAGKQHYGYMESESKVSFYWTHFKYENQLNACLKHLKLGNHFQLNILFNQLLQSSNSPSYPSFCSDYYIRLILTELLIYAVGESKFNNPLLYNIKEWIRNNSDRIVKSSEVAKHFGYNEDYISRLFKKYYSCNLKSYIDTVKMQQVKALMLSTNCTLKEIAYMSGFTDYKCFLKYFKYHEKISPSDFRSLYFKIHTNNK